MIDIDRLVAEAARRHDYPPLEAGQTLVAHNCPASAALSENTSWLAHRYRTVWTHTPLPDGFRGSAILSAYLRAERAGMPSTEVIDRGVAEAQSWDWAPPGASQGPLTLAYYPNRDVRLVEHVPMGVCGTATVDCAWAAPSPLIPDGGRLRIIQGSTLYVVKFSLSTDVHARPPECDPELWTGACLLSRHLEHTGAVVAMHLTLSEDAFHQEMVLQPAELVAMEFDFREVIARVEEARASRHDGWPDIVVGTHCESCPVLQRCPGWLSELRALDVMHVEHALSATHPIDDPERAVALYLSLGRVCHQLGRHLRSYVDRAGPIELDDGRTWGSIYRESHSYDGEEAVKLLQAKLGAALHVPMRLDESAIRSVLREAAKQKPIDVDAMMVEVHEQLAARGAVHTSRPRSFVIYRQNDAEETEATPQAEATPPVRS